MEITKNLKLGGLIELKISELYQQDAIDGIKQELQAKHGVKLIKHLTDNEFLLVCKNAWAPHFCNYCFRLNRRLHRILQLQNFHLQHNSQCRNPEQAHFLRNRHILNQNYEAITKMIRKRLQSGQPMKNPIELLEIFCEQENLPKNFLYDGLKSMELKRKLKKKFDNIIADARRKCREFVLYTSDQKMKDQDENVNEMNKQENQDKETNQKPKIKQENPIQLSSNRPLKRRIHKFQR